ncbi:unnamed protein product [Calypogeia fissa]
MPTFKVDAELPASAPRVWLALKDSPTIVPKVAPHAVASIQVEGTGETIGTVRLVKFGTAAPPGAYVKEKVLVLDQTTLSVCTEEVEGGHLVQGFTKWVTTWKLTAISEATCKWEASVEYEGENEAAIAQAKEGMTKLFVGLATYVRNTGAYA